MELHRKAAQCTASASNRDTPPSSSGYRKPETPHYFRTTTGTESPDPRPLPRSVRRPEAFRPNPALRLLDQCREVLRFHHFSYRTEQSYLDWIRRFILFHGKRHPGEMGRGEGNAVLCDRAIAGFGAG